MTEQNHHQLFRMARKLLAPCVEEIPAAKNLSGSAQVTAVLNASPFNMSDLAGTSPHAPHALSHEKSKNKGEKEEFFGMRLSTKLKSNMLKRVKILETNCSSYVSDLIIRDLGLPLDEQPLIRNKELKEAYTRNTVALNRVGNLLNQITAATHKGMPCALTREQVSDMQRRFAAACIERQQLRPAP